MNRKTIHLLEIVWLTLGIISLLAGIYNWLDVGLTESMMFFIITLVSIMMYFHRRHIRRSSK
jgi:energy-converting hydrogenase Eha subunit C